MGNALILLLTYLKRTSILGIHTINIVADIRTSVSISNVAVEMYTYNSTTWIQLNQNIGNGQKEVLKQLNLDGISRYEFERKAITGGTNRIRVRVDGASEYYYSSEETCEENAPTRARIRANGSVMSYFTQQWNKTTAFARDDADHFIKEFGCVVLFNPLDKTYLFSDGTGTPVRVDSNFKEAKIIFELSQWVRNPNNADPIKVAIFHTHPPMCYAHSSFTDEIPAGPSAPDENNANKEKLPGFVWCYNADIDKRHDIDDPNGIQEYGYNKREFF